MPRRRDEDEKADLTPEEKEKNNTLDEMLRRGVRKRDEVLGQDYFSRLRHFWAMRQVVSTQSQSPTFRPNIQFSDLHWMAMQEAGDLTDNNPLPVITRDDGKRIESHERALRGQWFVGQYGMSFFHACLEAQLTGVGFLMMMHDPFGRGGRGNTVLKPLETENCVVDEGCSGPDNWQYVIYRSKLSLDEIKRHFPARHTDRLPKYPSPAQASVPKIGQTQGESPDYLRMPPGPMQQVAVGPLGKSTGDLRTIEYFLFKDDSRKAVEEVSGSKKDKLMPDPEDEPRYPNGRMIIRCDKVHLYDGPVPYKRFNFIPVRIHPNRNQFWCTPPIRLVIQLQELAQTLERQNIENIVRLNNGLVVVNESMGVKADSILGLPGERIVATSPDGVDKAIKILTPPAFPDNMMSKGQQLLDKMKNDYGHTPERTGKMPAGNVSSSLFDTSMSAASGITQVRARLAQPAVQMALEMVYETMIEYQNPVFFPLPNEQNTALEFVEWVGVDPRYMAPWELLVDPSSTRAMSSMMARQFALILRNAGLLDVKSTLISIGWPGADDIAAKVEQEMQMQLLAKESSRGRPQMRS